MPALDVAPPHTRMPAQQLDMWSSIHAPANDDCATKPEPPAVKPKPGYPMATVRRSMSQESLSLCTESLGCETGTRGDFLDLASLLYAPTPADDTVTADFFSPPALQEEEEEEEATGELTLREVQYHRARPQRAFPPPLPSMSRRGGDDAGPCLRVRPHRRNGRLVLEAVAAKHQGYLHAQRQDGRLKLCFVECSSSSASAPASVVDHQKQSMVPQPKHEEEEDEEDEDEDEVEVVDRGTVVEVVAASGKAQRCSRIVMNKFVGGAPATDDLNAVPSPSRGSRAAEEEAAQPATLKLRRVPSSTTTLAAAVAAASAGMQSDDEDEEEVDEETESAPLLFTSRVGDREGLVQSVRRCRQLRQRPLFIVEPYSIVAA
ncbi:protein FAF-like, chloroplastic [Hordeum vulgare]|nr:protein FAF-like, chloroplastic [Hordeum vulgare]